MTQAEPYRWTMLASVSFLYLTFGFLVGSMAPLASAIRADLGLSKTAFGLAIGAWTFVYIGASPVAGRVLDRIGLRSALLLGGVLCTVSGLLRATAQGLPTLWMAVAVFGIGGPLISAGAPKLVSVWFADQDERRIALGIYAAAPAVGGTIVLFLTNSVLVPAFGDWRRVLLVDAMVMLVAVVAWVAVSGRVAEPAQPAAEPAGTIRIEWGRLLGSPTVRLALIVGLGTFFINHGLSAWLPSILEEERGLTPSVASNWVAVSSFVGVVSMVLLPRFVSLAGPALVYIAAVSAAGLAVLGVALLPDAFVPLAVVLVGVRSGLISLVLLMLFEADGVTSANMGAANGLFFSLVQFGGVGGPLVLGAIGDSAWGFTGSLLVVVGVCAVLAGLRQAGHQRAVRLAG